MQAISHQRELLRALIKDYSILCPLAFGLKPEIGANKVNYMLTHNVRSNRYFLMLDVKVYRYRTYAQRYLLVDRRGGASVRYNRL